MNRLGDLHAHSKPPNPDAARPWYERAADAGNTDAMYSLGIVHLLSMSRTCQPREGSANGPPRPDTEAPCTGSGW